MAMHRNQRFDSERAFPGARDYPRLLRAVFRNAVGFALASTLTVPGCAALHSPAANEPSEVDDQQMPRAGRGDAKAGSSAPVPEGTVMPHCEDKVLRFLDGITPGEPFDGLEFRVAHVGQAPQTVTTSGTLCGTANSEMACRAAITEAESTLPHRDVCGMIGNCDRYFIATQGDDVRMYASRTDVLKLLGPIDSPEDVALLLHYDGFDVNCADSARMDVTGGPDAATIRPVDDGFEANVVLLVSTCLFQYARVTMHIARDGTVTERSRELLPEHGGCAGRRPEGLLSKHAPSSDSALGEHFARMAHLEAASISAFEVLRAELLHHGAPAALIEAASRAAEDELRHTALTTALARRFGAEPTAPSVEARPLRSLEAIALDNAVEGCVRECFGAALGCFQARAARDPEIGRVMTEIAADETLHAALAFELAAWLDARLDGEAKARVTEARRRAASELRAELACTAQEPVRRALGLPDARAALRLFATLEQQLWAA